MFGVIPYVLTRASRTLIRNSGRVGEGWEMGHGYKACGFPGFMPAADTRAGAGPSVHAFRHSADPLSVRYRSFPTVSPCLHS